MMIKQSNLLTEQKIKIDLYCIKYSKFTKNNNIKTNYKLDQKNNLYSCCIDCGFKKFETIDKKQLSSLLYCLECREKNKVKTQGL